MPAYPRIAWVDRIEGNVQVEFNVNSQGVVENIRVVRASHPVFETNVIEDNYSERINQVVSIFSPRQFSLVLTTSMVERCRSLHATMLDAVPGYLASEKSLYEFDCGYAVTFLSYLRR